MSLGIVVVVELSSYRACSKQRGSANYTIGALAILVVAPGIKKKPVVSQVPEAKRAGHRHYRLSPTKARPLLMGVMGKVGVWLRGPGNEVH